MRTNKQQCTSDPIHTSVDFNIYVELVILMNAGELRRWLARQGCTFETHKGAPATRRFGAASGPRNCPRMAPRKNLARGW